MANPFYVEPAQFGQGLQSLAGSVQQFGQQRAEQQRLQEQQEYEQRARQAMTEAVRSRDPQLMLQVATEFPEVSETMQQYFGFTNDQTKRIATDVYRQALSDRENAAQILEQGIAEVERFGGTPSTMRRDLEMLQRDPEAGMRNIELGFAGVAPDIYKTMQGGRPDIGTYNPRDYTTRSFAEFQRTGDPSVLQRYEASRVIDIGGVPHLLNPADQTITPGRITSSGFQATGEPQSTGAPVTTETVARSEAKIAGERTKAQETARQRAKEESPEVKEQRRLKEQEADRTVGLIDRLLESDNLGRITGAETAVPLVGAAQAMTARDELNDLRALSNLLTMGNLGRMSGVLSESDIRLIANAASGVEVGEYGTPISEDRLREILQDIRRRMTNRQQPQEQQSGPNIDDLINKYSD